MDRVEKYGLQVDARLAAFVAEQALPGTGVEADAFWQGFSALVADLGPKNRALLDKRADLQAKIDAWHLAHKGAAFDAANYQAFLRQTGYIVPEQGLFQIETKNTDIEIGHLPGPQLVVPVTNARYALNAANARWGSLYDALYGTDALGDLPPKGAFDPARGKRVVSWAKKFLDDAVPLMGVRWADLVSISVKDHALQLRTAGGSVMLKDPTKFAGYRAEAGEEDGDFFFSNNGLHICVMVDRSGAIGAGDKAGIDDVMLEAAISSIMDCEDSVACVDAPDKIGAYANWLGLMKGDLVGDVREARRDDDPQPEPRPGLHRCRWRTGAAEGPGADAGAQRGPPDDHARDPGRRAAARWAKG